jgi:hypothetical protein
VKPPEIDAACEHLCKLLGMLGSTHPGERGAAGLKADQFVRKLGLTWSDIICTSPSLVPPDPSPAFAFDDIPWTDALGLVLARRHELRERDRRFVESLNEWDGTPTAKQIRWLKDIYERLGGWRP